MPKAVANSYLPKESRHNLSPFLAVSCAVGTIKKPHEKRLVTLATRNRCPIDNKTRCYDKTVCHKCAIAEDAKQQQLSKPKPKVIKKIKRKSHTVTYWQVPSNKVKDAYDKMHEQFKREKEVEKKRKHSQ